MQLTDDEGNVRRLEELASGTAIGWHAQKRLKTWDKPTLLRESATVDGAACASPRRSMAQPSVRPPSKGTRWRWKSSPLPGATWGWASSTCCISSARRPSLLAAA